MEGWERSGGSRVTPETKGTGGVGCRGFAGCPLYKILSRLGIRGASKRKAIQSASEAAGKAIKWLWIKRADPWLASETQVRVDQPRLRCLGKTQNTQCPHHRGCVPVHP